MTIFKTIRTKIIFIILSVFIPFLLIHTMYQIENIKKQSFSTLESINKTINSILVEYNSAYIYNHDISNIQLTIDAINSEYVKAIYILDENGFIIAQNRSNNIQNKLYPKFKLLKSLKDKSIKNTDEYLVLNTFEILDIPIGYMVVEANLKTYKNSIEKEMNILGLGTLLSLAFFMIASMFIANSLSAPIEKIIKKLQSTKDDEYLNIQDQAQVEFQYLVSSISNAHNRLRDVNSNLELEVDAKTKELQELNKNLENKIKEAIVEIEQKSKMLEQHSRMAQMGEMISMIAHQWRQPLGAISAVCIDLRIKMELEDYDLQTKKGQESFVEYVDASLVNISDFVQNLTTTVDDFRNFYRPDKQVDPIIVNDIIDKSLNVIIASLVSSGVVIHKNYKSTQVLKIYKNELMQVVLNLFKNAQDNFKDKKTIEPKIDIVTYDKDSFTYIKIYDNGGGIKENIIDKIFDPYFSTKDEKNGTGLGLYMSKTIIEEHHKGSLYAENIYDGVCFVIKLRHT